MDKYDEAVEYFTANPLEIRSAWFMPKHHKHGCLFYFLTHDGSVDFWCGCLMQIKHTPDYFGRNVPLELVNEIVNDSRIPVNISEITVESLPVFAEYQRKADTVIRNK